MISNPLRDPRDRRIPRVAGPCVLVMFGVTGDLASKKLLPAVYDLANRGLLPPGFSLVGFARRDWAHEDFGQVAYEAVKLHSRTPYRDTVWQQVLEGVRIVPGEFADDLKSARELNATLDAVFPAQSVFRIDHYLGKETVQNILALRFANTLYEPIWNRGYVDHVQITMSEDIGIGGRAGY